MDFLMRNHKQILLENERVSNVYSNQSRLLSGSDKYQLEFLSIKLINENIKINGLLNESRNSIVESNPELSNHLDITKSLELYESTKTTIEKLRSRILHLIRSKYKLLYTIYYMNGTLSNNYEIGIFSTFALAEKCARELSIKRKHTNFTLIVRSIDYFSDDMLLNIDNQDVDNLSIKMVAI